MIIHRSISYSELASSEHTMCVSFWNVVCVLYAWSAVLRNSRGTCANRSSNVVVNSRDPAK